MYGADFTGDVCKPQAEAFRMVMEDCGAKAESSAMFEDSLRNVVAAKELGMTTVFITCRQNSWTNTSWGQRLS